ncbi:hypothetical protein [Plastoroseomonas arctica]|uniref:DUF4189 domain-containing protein n=1 Tax=Plastoroseomonas arctica TaxID=1509237 RepID=A0AAF1JXT3_9PROT|nr:hypothetical protein [Plastoroseomonas arctica]MBR0656057.1 hypothetical protein [Plastoroseomonas arctica]
MRAGLALAALLLTAMPAAAAWTVFCVNGRVTVDARSEAVLRADRGTACALSRGFSSLPEAQAQAQSRTGGVGGFCSCR